MAIIIPGKTLCPLCDDVITESDEIVGVPHFIADKNDPLWRYSDAAFHRACFLTWAQHDTFIEHLNQVARNFIFGDGSYHHMKADGTYVHIKLKADK